ncbi:unnamed protein product [Merluccius merluccius]
MNTRQAFQMAKTLTGSAPRPSTPIPPEQGHQLNIFFNRFDADDYTEECRRQFDALPLLDPNDPALLRGGCQAATEEMQARQGSRARRDLSKGAKNLCH